MPGLPEVWQWEEQLVGFGTRYTGSSGHAAYVDWLAGQLSAVPGVRMRTDRLTFSRWLARDFALTVSIPASAGRSGPVPLTTSWPPAATPPGGQALATHHHGRAAVTGPAVKGTRSADRCAIIGVVGARADHADQAFRRGCCRQSKDACCRWVMRPGLAGPCLRHDTNE
jgi:hypothetical protein